MTGAFLLLAALAPARAGEIAVTVKDAKGEPVKGAVVFVSKRPGKAPAPPKEPLVMEQKDKEFEPRFLVVPLGAKVSFPNRDSIHHHLYSFSPAKTFEQPLSKGQTAEPVLFDKPGVVKLGCNIHDWMGGVLLVLEHGPHAETDAAGRAALTGVAPGKGVQVAVYHEGLRVEPAETAKPAAFDGKGKASVAFELDLKKVRRKTRPASGYGSGY